MVCFPEYINYCVFYWRNSLFRHWPSQYRKDSHYGNQFKDFEIETECGTHFGKEEWIQSSLSEI
jgi:hypothetical protein